MKRRLAILLSIVTLLVFGLAGCKPDDTGPTPEEILALITEASDLLALPATTSTDLSLPTLLDNDVSVRWESSDTNRIANDGTVTIPTKTEGDQTVTIVATLELDDQEMSKTFTVIVLAASEYSDTELLVQAIDTLDLSISGNVTDDLSLPTTGANGTTIAWSSDNPSVLANDGTVTRPTYGEGDVTVTLTATVTLNELSDTKEFDISVAEEAFDTVISLIDDGELWLDVDYAYAQSQGTNPLAAVEYDKGELAYAKLVKEIDGDFSDYSKLSISISGLYYIMLTIVSEDVDGTEQNESYYINLSDELEYYEIDIHAGDVITSNIIRLEFIATPGASQHHGHFEVSLLAFSKHDFTVDALSNETPTQITNTYNTGDSFDFNLNWHDTSHTYVTDGNDVLFSRLPNTSTGLSSAVSGDFSDFDYINLTLSGDPGTTLLVSATSSSTVTGDILPELTIELTETPTLYTLFIDELSLQARESITRITIVAEPNSLIATSGTFTIHSAEFSNETTVERPEPTVNYYFGDGMTFDFNNFWDTVNSMAATFDETTDEAETVVAYTKQFVDSAIIVNLDGAFSDFDFINIAMEGEPYQEYLIQSNMQWGYRLDHYVTADETGLVEVTMIFALQYFDYTIDDLSVLTITPSPNESDDTGTFTITTAEFSNTALVDYTLTNPVSFDDIVQVGDDIMINDATDTLSWTTQEQLNPVFTRIYGDLVPFGSFVYPKLGFDAIVNEDMLLTLEVDGAFYEVNLTTTETSYNILLANPTSGLASTWKFSGGFNLYFHLDPTVSGELTLSNIRFFDTETPVEDRIDVNDEVLVFNGLGGTVTQDGTEHVVAFTKSAFNSLFYFLTSGAKLGGSQLSDYTYFNLYLESDDVTEALVQLSGFNSMTYYTTFEDGMMKLTVVMKPAMLDSQIDSLNYINVTPMPNSEDASGTIRVIEAYFSNTPLVDYTTQTTVSGQDFHEVGSVFTVSGDLISWSAVSGYHSLMVRMNGTYADDTEILYPEIVLTATVTESTSITLDINGAWYILTLVPEQTEYTIDVTNPDSGAADLWKFETGFNLQLMIETSTAGSIDLTSIEFQAGV